MHYLLFVLFAFASANVDQTKCLIECDKSALNVTDLFESISIDETSSLIKMWNEYINTDFLGMIGCSNCLYQDRSYGPGSMLYFGNVLNLCCCTGTWIMCPNDNCNYARCS